MRNASAEEQDLDNDDEQMDVDVAAGGAPTIQSLAARRRKGISKRKLAFLSPRLGVLNNIPQTVRPSFVSPTAGYMHAATDALPSPQIPFEVRVEIFRAFIRYAQRSLQRLEFNNADQRMRSILHRSNDKLRLGIDRYSRSSPKYATTIRRHKVAEDGYAQLNAIGAGMKGTVAITFVDQWGQEEAGIDGGGVFKEFLTSLSSEVFNTDRGLWQATKQQELYPAPTQYATEAHQLNWYQFIGRVLGKALYEGILADVSFAGFFLKKWLGRRTDFNDLASLDQELYQGLIKLKQFDGNVEELALTFTLDVDDFGVTETVDLVPNGSKCVVNTAIVDLGYVELTSNLTHLSASPSPKRTGSGTSISWPPSSLMRRWTASARPSLVRSSSQKLSSHVLILVRRLTCSRPARHHRPQVDPAL